MPYQIVLQKCVLVQICKCCFDSCCLFLFIFKTCYLFLVEGVHKASHFVSQKRLKTSSGALMPSSSAVDVNEELSKEFLTLQPVYVVKDYIRPLNTEPSDSGNTAVILGVEESGSKFIAGTNNCVKRTITHVSEKGDSVAALELSVTPSVCPINLNLEADNQSNDAMLENHRDSQSSSTPCCSIVFTDEENDARSKEMEWLESLDNVLREKKKDRGESSLIVDSVTNCRERFNSMVPRKSSEPSVNNHAGIVKPP